MAREKEATPNAPAASWFARDLPLGLLACVPLLLAYEAATASTGGAWRNSAEMLLTLPLRALGEYELLARRIALLVMAFACVWRLYAPDYALVQRTARVIAEGAAWALVFGPAALALHALLDAPVPRALLSTALPPIPDMALVGIACGGAAWEELLFRVVLLALGARVAARYLAPLAGTGRAGRALAWSTAMVPVALLFAASHLSAVNGLFGRGGEHFDAALFAWRTLSGILLAVLYAWRGVGVAAWCHATVNALLLIGASPGVFL